jgi:hypothetical protein
MGCKVWGARSDELPFVQQTSDDGYILGGVSLVTPWPARLFEK